MMKVRAGMGADHRGKKDQEDLTLSQSPVKHLLARLGVPCRIEAWINPVIL